MNLLAPLTLAERDELEGQIVGALYDNADEVQHLRKLPEPTRNLVYGVGIVIRHLGIMVELADALTDIYPGLRNVRIQ